VTFCVWGSQQPVLQNVKMAIKQICCIKGRSGPGSLVAGACGMHQGISLTKNAPTTESSTEPPHGVCPGLRSPSTPLGEVHDSDRGAYSGRSGTSGHVWRKSLQT
jgi:hypothetical protein